MRNHENLALILGFMVMAIISVVLGGLLSLVKPVKPVITANPARGRYSVDATSARKL